MKRIFSVFFLFLLSLTSCIEIVEEITLYDNHSGNIKYRLETNQIASFLNNLTDLLDGSFENHLKGKTREFAGKIKSYEGIDSVKFNWDGKKNKNLLEFSFSSPGALNDAIYQLIGYKKNLFTPVYIKATSHAFQRKNFAPWVKKYLENEGIEIPAKDFMDLVTYKTIVHYPTEVKRFKGKNLKLTDNRKGLIQTNNLREVLENKTNVSIKSKQ
jgi:hypothetical protein